MQAKFTQKKRCPYCQAEIDNPLQVTAQSIFNWTSCQSCKQHIFYTRCQCTNAILSKDKLFFGGKINCEVCNKYYQLVPCPTCKNLNYWNGNYNMGAFINCFHCKANFQHMACPFCKESNFWIVDKAKNMFYKFGLKVQCFHCKKNFQQMNCPHCRENKYYTDCNYSQGITEKCYKCSNTFQHCNCPTCGFAHFFKNRNFTFGEAMSCHECKVQFTFSHCDKCKNLNAKHSVYSLTNAADFVCSSSVCKSAYRVYGCPKCKAPNYLDAQKNDTCIDTVCSECRERFQVATCSKCKTTGLCNCAGTKPFHTCTKCHATFQKTQVSAMPTANTNTASANNVGTSAEKPDEDKFLCKICFIKNIDTMFEGCGHACCCFDCARDLKKKECPMCRQVSNFKKLFFG